MVVLNNVLVNYQFHEILQNYLLKKTNKNTNTSTSGMNNILEAQTFPYITPHGMLHMYPLRSKNENTPCMHVFEYLILNLTKETPN